MILEGVNLASIVVAGLIAGYAMTFVGNWLEGFLNLPGFNLSQAGRVYLGEDRRLVSNFLLHGVYGFVLGALYVPPGA